MEKNEVIVVDKEEVMDVNFQRVDFNEPSTVLSYGQDVISEIEKMVSEVTSSISEEYVPDEEFYERVDELSGFSTKLDKLEEKKEKSNEGINKFLNFINRKILKDESNEKLSYSQEYQKYVDSVDQVVREVEMMYNSSRNDFELFSQFIKRIKPYIGVLQQVYSLGFEDRVKFSEEVIDLEQKYAAEPDNVDYKRESIYKRQVLDIFDEKLFGIQKSIASINEIVIQWNLRQMNAIKQLTSYQSFLTLDKSVLKLNGTALVGAKKQKEEVERLQYLVDGVNAALVQGPKELNDNIRGINELTKEGNIRVSTLAEIDKYLQEGVNLLKQGAKEKKAFIEANTKELEKISMHFKQFNEEVKEQILLDNYNSVAIDVNVPVPTKQKNKRK